MPVVDGLPPDAGDLVWIDFGPPVGHEQSGLRPAIVVSPRTYNRSSSVLLVCPITRNDRFWPFKVRLQVESGSLYGFVIADQVRAVDPEIRFLRSAGRASEATTKEVQGKLAAIFGR